MIPFILLLLEGLSLTASLGSWKSRLAFPERSRASDDCALALAPQMVHLVLNLRPQPAADTGYTRAVHVGPA